MRERITEQVIHLTLLLHACAALEASFSLFSDLFVLLWMGADAPSIYSGHCTEYHTLARKSLRIMASQIDYASVPTDDTSPPLYNKEASSDDESTEYTVVRRKRSLTILHWIAHGVNLTLIVILAIRVLASEPLQSRCHKLFNYYCMISYGLFSIAHK
jgi:hypothetical protein